MGSSSVAPGDRVRVITSGNTLDPNTYVLESFDGIKANLICVETNIRMSLHRSRVSASDERTEEEIMNDSNEKTKITTASKQKTAKASAERTPFDFAAELAALGAGAEHWRKTNNFDHDSITSEAHVLISGDRASFRSLNTYDGSLGKNGKAGQIYDLKNYDKKVKDLQTRGYVLVSSREPVVSGT